MTAGAHMTMASIRDAMGDYLAARASGGAPVPPEDLEACREIAGAALDFLLGDSGLGAARGSPPGGIAWLVLSALWAGRVPQERIDAFFGEVNVDFARLFRAWEGAGPGQGPVTLALVPGSLTEADILDVVRALYAQRRGG